MLEKLYEPIEKELKWKEYWEAQSIYKFDTKSDKPAYTIDTPPPTVSGNMHIGHAFSYAQQDFIARYKRMKGFNVYYPFGTDDNGLPTERMVEKLKNVKSSAMKRDEFIQLCRDTIAEVEPEFVEDWKRIGMSCEFSQVYSTIDLHCVKTSQASFIELHKKGLIYRKKSPGMWCVNCQTAIAQAELEDKESSGSYCDVAFKVGNGKEVIISTTRPELLPACLAIFAHPNDERHKALIGKEAIVPLFGQKVPVLADESADPAKGSGLLMVCSYGDRFDADAVKRRSLKAFPCIEKDGRMNEHAHQYAGLTVKQARTAITQELEKSGLLKGKKSITHAVNVHDKCQTDIEFLESEQWFVRVVDFKDQLIKAGRQIIWHPESMRMRYEHWVKNLNWDWCISRQRHFGVPFPVWYSKKTGEPIIASGKELPVDPSSHLPRKLPKGINKKDITFEQDVMDTWATSSLSPQIITNWIRDEFKSAQKDVSFKEHFPVSLRPQAHDIIRTWAFYTIVKAFHHHKKIPWQTIIISGNVADPKGEKMSKSKGNIIEPRAVISKYSADVLRYWACSSRMGDDLSFQEKELVAGKRLANKLWNASQFCIQHLEGYEHKEHHRIRLELTDKWLLASLNKAISEATFAYESYNPSEVRRTVEDFFWKTFCDYYLEIVKYRLYSESTDETTLAAKRSAQYTIYLVLLNTLKLLAPVLCFITEELYQAFYSNPERDGFKSIHMTHWPEARKEWHDEQSLEAGNAAAHVIGEARKFKAKHQMGMKQELSVVEAQISTELDNLAISDFNRMRLDIINTVKVKELQLSKSASNEFSVKIRI